MKRNLLIFILWFVYFFYLGAQTYPIAKDISCYQGSYTVLSFEMNGNVTNDSLTFGVKPDMEDSTARVINKHNTAGGGSDADIQVIYGNKSTVLVKLLTDDIGGLTPAIYYYDLWKDTNAIYYGSFKIINSVTGKSDGIATRYPYYTIAVDSSNKEPGIALFRDSDNSVEYINFEEAKDSFDVYDSSQVAARIAAAENEIDSLFFKTASIVRIEEYIGVYDTSAGWSLVIQAAVDANLSTGNSLLFNQNKVYELQQVKANPYSGYANHKTCIDLKTGGVNLIIPSSTVLKLKDNQQIDGTSIVDMIVWKDAVNIYLGGGGEITGNTAGQAGWTGGYEQIANGCIIYGYTTFGEQNNHNIIIENLKLNDHWSNSLVLSGGYDIVFRNLTTHSVGEGFAFIGLTNFLADGLTVNDSADVARGDAIETSGCSNGQITNCIVLNKGFGSAIDIYTSINIMVSNFIIDGWNQGIGTENWTGGFSTDITFQNGLIKNSGTAIIGGDGRIKYENITVDSCQYGFLVTKTSYATGDSLNIFNNCIFSNNTTAGGYVTGQRVVEINNCDFYRNGSGLSIARGTGATSDPAPTIYATGCYIFQNTNGLSIGEGADTEFQPDGFFKDGFIGNNTNNIVSGRANSWYNFEIKNASLISMSSINIKAAGYETLPITSATLLNNIQGGAENQTLKVIFNVSATLRDKDDYGSGDINLKGNKDETFQAGDYVILWFNKDSTYWYEVSRSNNLIGNSINVIDGWMKENVDDSLSHVTINRWGNTFTMGNRYYVTRDCYLTKIGVASNEARTTGTLTIEMYENTSGPQRTVVLDGTNTTTNTNNLGRGNKLITAGTYIQIKISTSNDWAPTTADITAWIELEY